MNYIIAYLYLFLGYYFIYNNENINKNYLALLIFFSFKIIFNYRKCTISYIECKLRGVKKEQGYLYRFLDIIINLRYSN